MKGLLAVSKKKINLRKESALACFLFYHIYNLSGAERDREYG